MTGREFQTSTVVRVGNMRGTSDRWINEGKLVVNSTRLSCYQFLGIEARLWLSVIAYDLWNIRRRLELPNKIGNWSLTNLQQRLVKTGGHLNKGARF